TIAEQGHRGVRILPPDRMDGGDGDHPVAQLADAEDEDPGGRRVRCLGRPGRILHGRTVPNRRPIQSSRNSTRRTLRPVGIEWAVLFPPILSPSIVGISTMRSFCFIAR